MALRDGVGVDRERMDCVTSCCVHVSCFSATSLPGHSKFVHLKTFLIEQGMQEQCNVV